MENKQDIRWIQRYSHDGWRKMLKARNTTSYTCNEGEALSIVECIYNEYAPLLKKLDKRLSNEASITGMGNLF